MPYRKINLVNGEVYHIMSKSIAGFKIFNNNADFERMISLMIFYNTETPQYKFSYYLNHVADPGSVTSVTKGKSNSSAMVKIVAYCIMPTHIHYVLQQLKESGISKYINFVLKSYSSYFNIKYKRKGPLWEGRFKNVLVESDEQLLHLTRYVHLNPVTAELINQPEQWKHSSYNEYIVSNNKNSISCYKDLLDINPNSYKIFTNDRIAYQKELGRVKHLMLE